MKKITLFAFLIISISFSICFPVYGTSTPPKIVDNIDVLTSEQEEWLTNNIMEVCDKYSFDIVILTCHSLGDKTATEYADDYYDYNGYSEDGILLLISTEYRNFAVSTKGYGMTVFTDRNIDRIIENIRGDLSSENYFRAFSDFVYYCNIYAENASNETIYGTDAPSEEHFPFVSYIIISLVIGFAVAFITTAVMKSKLKSVRPAANASSYIKSGSFKLSESRDLFLYSTVTKTPRQQNNSSKGASFGHISSSGSRHGGRSGKF